MSPTNLAASVTSDDTGVSLGLLVSGPFPNGVTITSEQSFNLGSAGFTMTVDPISRLGGIGQTAYTRGVNSRSNGGASQDGRSDEHDLEFI